MAELKNLAHGEEVELVRRCKRGEREAFDELILRYQDRVYNLCYHLLGNEEDALDLSQEAFITCFKKMEQFEERSSFYTWFYRMVVNLSKNFRKYHERRGRSKTESLDEPVELGNEKREKQFAAGNPSPRDCAASKQEMEILKSKLQVLVPEFRQVLLLRYMEGMSYEDISQVLKCSLGTVKSRISRARSELRKLMRGVL